MPLTTDVVAQHLFDAIALAVVIGVIACYQAYLRALGRRNPSAVLSCVAAIERAAWVESMMADRNNGVLAIQTLRNSTMASTFMASTSILLMVGVMTLSGQAPALKTTWHYLNVVGSLEPELWMIKLLTLLLLLFFAFYCFSNAIRIFNHVGYMINVQKVPETMRLSPPQIASELNRGGDYYSLGTRTFYYLIPFIFWLFGPIYMMIATLVLVVILLPRIDRTPARMRAE